MSTIQDRVSPFIVAFYAWIITVFFGAVLLDTLYSNLIPGATVAFSEISDFLLLIGVVTFISALGAIVFSWKLSIARNYFIASLVVVLFEFFIPVLFSQSINNTPGSRLTATIRITINGTASILSLIGMHKYYRQN